MGKRLSLFALLAIGIFVAVAIAIFPGEEQGGAEAEHADAVPDSGTELFEVPLLSSEQTREIFPERNLTISLDLPRVSLLKHPELAQAANAVIGAFVDAIVADATGDITELPLERSEEPSSDFALGWTPLLVSPEIVSIRFDHSFYFPGAAHPDNRTRILNYDLRRRIVLPTTDLFASSTLALPHLSAYARRMLPERLQDGSGEGRDAEFAAGTEPTIENFREVGIVSDGLLIVFNPSQVAAYARGTVTLPVPLADVKAFIAPEVADAIRRGSENFREAVPIE